MGFQILKQMQHLREVMMYFSNSLSSNFGMKAYVYIIWYYSL